MEHKELETTAEMLGVLCEQAGLDARDTLLVMSGKRSLQVGNVAVSLTGSAASYDGRFPVAGTKTARGQKDLGDIVADALEGDFRLPHETPPERPTSGAKDMGDLVADALECGCAGQRATAAAPAPAPRAPRDGLADEVATRLEQEGWR